jgi:hypothetical protein
MKLSSSALGKPVAAPRARGLLGTFGTIKLVASAIPLDVEWAPVQYML